MRETLTSLEFHSLLGFRAPLLIQIPSRYGVAQEILTLTYQIYAAR